MYYFARQLAIRPACLLLILCVIASTSDGYCSAGEGWQKQVIHEKFFAEGTSAGDIDGDGVVDLVAGPMWFQGPEFKSSKLIDEPREFSINTYSDQFFSSVFDANDDGANDVLVLGFPGKSARLYLNPGHDQLEDQRWAMSEVASIVDNESPAIVDLIPGGFPEIVCGREGQFGFYAAGEDATQPWTWTAVSRPGTSKGRFEHGMGVGDVNGDGRMDLLNRTSWWENPGASTAALWVERQWAPGNYGGGGAQICVVDMDLDGDADIVTSFNAHAYGLAWFEQQDGRFEQHNIMGASSIDNDYGVVFSQLHALAVRDINQDGRPDIVTGKRYWAHQGHDPGGRQQPVLYWFQNTAAEDSSGGIDFVPREIDDDSGVGVDVLVADLNDDAALDVVTCSKRGLMVHRQVPDRLLSSQPQKWNDPEGKDQSKYVEGLDPQAAAEAMKVAPGFEVDLLASEPELTQPIAMCFDAKGRIWVVEGLTYPQKAADGQGQDRIVILSDEDADGSFETKKVFLEGLNLVSGIEVGFGGVWIGAAPEFLFIPDANQDDVPDGEPTVLLDGWGYQDTHETLNSFTWGPDGWLYGCHGIFTHSRVGKPGTPDAERIPLNAGVWRYHPVDHRFEVFAQGTSNPWGVDFNDQGDWFITACVIPHLYHVTQGARYQRQAGQHFNPYTYRDVTTIADHAHYTGDIKEHAFWGHKPVAPIGTSLLGGGHAHCGLAIYNGGVFPPEYDGALLFHNLHGHRVVREKVVREGSGYVGHHRPDFALAQDHKQIGVGVMVGPDGALYTSDWHDLQTCHNRSTEIWDRTDGRLFRIRYGSVQPQAFDLWEESDVALVGRLRENGFFARAAQRVLHERAATGKEVDANALARLNQMLESDEQVFRLRALWTKFCIGAIRGDELREMLRDRDPFVRGWAVHMLGESYGSPREEISFENYDFRDESPVVRRYVASILQRLPEALRWKAIEGLVRYRIDGNDRNIPLLVWYGLEPLVPSDTSRALAAAQQSGWPDLVRFVIRRSCDSQDGREQLMTLLARGSDEAQRVMILEELVATATSRAGLQAPEKWPVAFQALIGADSERILELGLNLAVQFGDAGAFPFLRETLSNRDLPAAKRLEALKALHTAKDPSLLESLLGLLDDPQLNEGVISALAVYDDKRIPDVLLGRMGQFSEKARLAALNTLMARRSSAEFLVAAMEKDAIAASEVPAFIVRQAIGFEDQALLKRIEKIWGRVSTSSAAMDATYERYRKLLTERQIQRANAGQGRVVYEANCGTCHKLFGVGGTIGPDITGANRRDINYLLENILEPNALIGKAYQVSRFLVVGGRIVSGIVTSENEDAVTVQTATEKVILAKNDIELRKLSETSLMPAGQLETLKGQQILDLFKYLMSAQQVRLPGGASTAKTLPADATLFEGEALQGVSAQGGAARPQGMSGFGADWSGDSQLWWTGGKPGNVLKLGLKAPQPGEYDVLLQLTRAVDYAQVRVRVGQEPAREIDLFDPQVTLAPLLRFEGVEVNTEDLEVVIEVMGSNANAIASYMVGLDYIALVPRAEK